MEFKEMTNNVGLKIGEKYKVYQFESRKRDYSFDAFFIGRKKIIVEGDNSERNVFVCLYDGNQIKLYGELNSEMPESNKPFETSTMPVAEITTKISKLEKEFLIEKIKKWNEK